MFVSGEIDPLVIRNVMGRAEALGYHSVWVQDHVLGTMPALEPLSLLSYAAATTTRIKLGTAVMLTALHTPLLFAKSIATLDQLSRGRLILGVGLGGYADVYPAFGLAPKGRASRFEEGISLLKTLWTADAVNFDGRFWNMEGVAVNPKPFQKPHPPIWFGGHSAPALKRAVRMGDGWIGAGASSTEAFKTQTRLVRGILEGEGRDPATFTLSKRVYVAVDSNRQEASRKLQEWFGHQYGYSALAPKVSIFGSKEECVEGLGSIIDEGIDLLILNPVYDIMEQAQLLATEVIPDLKPIRSDV